MTVRKSIEWGTWAGTAAILALLVWMWGAGYLSHPEQFQMLLKSVGVLGPVLFMIVQIVQVVIPIIPGGLTSAVGVLAFGPFWGFVYNYVGLVLGSFAAFFLARHYGRPFIRKLVKPETYDKYIGWLDKREKFDWFFALAIFAPCAPDDLLCMIAGLTKMSVARFTCIILLGKPAALLVYSMGLTTLLQQVGSLI